MQLARSEVTLSQIKTYTEMDSHEERLHRNSAQELQVPASEFIADTARLNFKFGLHASAEAHDGGTEQNKRGRPAKGLIGKMPSRPSSMDLILT